MAKGKGKRSNSSSKSTGSKKSRRFFYSAMLLVIIVGIVLWQWEALASFVVNVRNGVVGLFGWGLVFVLLAVLALVIMWWLRRLSLVIHYWRQFLAGVVFIFAIWGALAFFPGEGILNGSNLGGDIGYGVIGYPDTNGLLRVVGLVILGIILVAPKASWHLLIKSIKKLASWVMEPFKQRPGPKRMAQIPQIQQQKALARQRQAAATVELNTAVERGMREKIEEPEVLAGAPPAAVSPERTERTRQDLRQVAQEVWKKYGESQSLVIVDGWKLPPIDILDLIPEVEFSEADNEQRARLIEEALASYGVEAKVVQINTGPTVTQFGVEPGWDRKMKEVREKNKDGSVVIKLKEISKTRVKVEKITSLANDLALALAAPSIRIEAPVPGKSIVGIEVPNTSIGVVSLRGVIESTSFQKTLVKSRLAIAMGKGAGGEAVAADLAKMPHLLIAGATGSGKTVCLNSIICCLLLSNCPNDVRFIMIDPKRVELTPFNSIPHLATPVVVDTTKALGTLRWLNQEMDKRYQVFATAGARNIDGYNKTRQREGRMPYLVLVIDELADLMMTSSDEVEHILCRLAQLARATGIHLVVATQRPSVDVVTGLIKANFPTRISFAVTSQVDSRTIIDSVGAEKLLGRGDMLYMPTDASKPKRLQGCFVSDPEAERLVYFWSNQRREEAATLKVEELITPAAAEKAEAPPEDAMMESARKLAKEHKNISTSFLQRRLRIGYPRAARIMEQLEEEMGVEENEEGEEEEKGE